MDARFHKGDRVRVTRPLMTETRTAIVHDVDVTRDQPRYILRFGREPLLIVEETDVEAADATAPERE